MGPPGAAASALHAATWSVVAIEVGVQVAEADGPGGRGHGRDLARLGAARGSPRRQAPVEDVDACGRVAVEAEEPVPADRLPVLADVVVEDDPGGTAGGSRAGADGRRSGRGRPSGGRAGRGRGGPGAELTRTPSCQRGLDVLARRQQPLALRVARGRVPAADRELAMEVAIDRARQVTTVVDPARRRHLDQDQVRVLQVREQPVDGDERCRALGGIRDGRRTGRVRGDGRLVGGRGHPAIVPARLPRPPRGRTGECGRGAAPDEHRLPCYPPHPPAVRRRRASGGAGAGDRRIVSWAGTASGSASRRSSGPGGRACCSSRGRRASARRR